jgi:hypothetical protein
VTLLADGREKETAMLSAKTQWKYIFSDLPKYDEAGGHEIAYTIKEIPVEGYTSTISGDAKSGFVILNKENPNPPQPPAEPSRTSLKIKKEWKGINPQDAPEVTIYLVKNGVKTNQWIKLNRGNHWSGEFKNLNVTDDAKADQENVYTVLEAGEKHGKVVLSGKAYKVSYMDGKVVNTRIEEFVSVPPDQTKAPRTGDYTESDRYAAILILSAGALLGAVIIRKYKKKAKQ